MSEVPLQGPRTCGDGARDRVVRVRTTEAYRGTSLIRNTHPTRTTTGP